MNNTSYSYQETDVSRRTSKSHQKASKANDKAFSLEAIGQESPIEDCGSVPEQLSSLRLSVLDIQEKYVQSSHLLQEKADENRKLKEKLAELEVTIQHLFDSAKASQSCFQHCVIE